MGGAEESARALQQSRLCFVRFGVCVAAFVDGQLVVRTEGGSARGGIIRRFGWRGASFEREPGAGGWPKRRGRSREPGQRAQAEWGLYSWFFFAHRLLVRNSGRLLGALGAYLPTAQPN